jgi:hypothetical protein
MHTLSTRSRRALATAPLLLAAAVLCATPARAAEVPSHTFLFSYYAAPEIECPSGIACPPYPPPREGFEDACGLAVDSAGDFYVSDYYHDNVDVFFSLTYQAQIKAESPTSGPCGLAVDSSGNLYVNNWRQNVVSFSATELQSPAATIDSDGSTGLALDPATGNLYVDDRTYVAEYEPPIEPGEEPVARIGLGTLGKGYGVAVSDFGANKGDVYVADSTDHTVKVYDPATSLLDPVSVIDGAGTPQSGFSSLVDASLAVDQTDGHLYVVDDLLEPFEHPAAVVDEFNATGDYRGHLPHPIVDAEPSGLALDSAGDVYVTSGNTEDALLLGFGPTAPGHTLEVSRSGAGVGTVIAEPAGIDCGTACAAEYNVGEALTLTAAPGPGSDFAGWTVNGNPNNCPGAAETCHLTLGADIEVGAEFTLAPQQAPIAPATLPAVVSPNASGAAPTTLSKAPASPVSETPRAQLGRHRHHRHRRSRGHQARSASH